MTLESRIIELESRQAFQDDNLQALNDALVAQQQVIDRLQRQLAALAARQEELQGLAGDAERESPPPHY